MSVDTAGSGEKAHSNSAVDILEMVLGPSVQVSVEPTNERINCDAGHLEARVYVSWIWDQC